MKKLTFFFIFFFLIISILAFKSKTLYNQDSIKVYITYSFEDNLQIREQKRLCFASSMGADIKEIRLLVGVPNTEMIELYNFSYPIPGNGGDLENTDPKEGHPNSNLYLFFNNLNLAIQSCNVKISFESNKKIKIN
ncbi:hypothetical protein [Tenacibaculum geojense]|uniref:Lipoprotein n=1 Tax=Tenacibaculum geojense TaxID=915352 RepID=A0ABW3JRH3_9FLAO